MYEVGEDPWFPNVLEPYIQNTEVLRVEFILPIEELAQALPGFPQSMPNLQSLSLSGPGDPYRASSADPFGPFTPTLRCLSLFTVPLYPSLLRLRALTKLVLYDVQFDVHLDTLLDFLEENRPPPKVRI